jgi:hypothetical protein
MRQCPLASAGWSLHVLCVHPSLDRGRSATFLFCFVFFHLLADKVGVVLYVVSAAGAGYAPPCMGKRNNCWSRSQMCLIKYCTLSLSLSL